MWEEKLSSMELETIDTLSRDIFEDKELLNDTILLLNDGISSLKHNLFFSSISIFTIFIEKYLRDTLILYEYRNNPWVVDEKDFMEFLEETEKRIEDEKENNRYYWFSEICNKLRDYWKLDQHIVDELLGLYESHRTPVQHWLYSRIIRTNVWLRKVPITKIAINPEWTAEDLIKALQEWTKQKPNSEMSIYNPITRMIVLPAFFKKESIKYLFIIKELLNIVNKNDKS